MRKGFAPVLALLVILLLAVGGGVVYFLKTNSNKQDKDSASIPAPTMIIATPTPIPQVSEKDVDWKTYQNDEYGFSLSYPSSWNLDENNFSSLAEFNVTFSSPDGNSVLDVMIRESNQTWESIATKALSEKGSYETMISGSPALVTSITDNTNITIVKHPRLPKLIYLDALGGDLQTIKELMNTFKFE